MRRTPQQERSRQMVERIVDAARTVLATDGYDGFSTNRIAHAAGISPGSLYQYFPDKREILAVVVDRFSDEVAERVVASFAARAGLTGPVAVRAGLDALLSALEADATLLRVVQEELPARQLGGKRRALERRVRELLTITLAAQRDRVELPEVRAWVVVAAVENLAERWVLDRPPVDRGVLLDEATALIGGYLSGPPGLER